MDTPTVAAFSRLSEATVEFREALTALIPHILETIPEDERVLLAAQLDALDEWSDTLVQITKTMREDEARG